MKTLIMAASLALAALPTHAMDFYLSSDGDDSRDATSPGSAWRTLRRASRHAFAPGDRLLLRGGDSFRGTLKLNARDAGTAQDPVTITSFGTGKATIKAGNVTAIDVHNAGGVAVENLILRGSGYPSNKGDGLLFRNTLKEAGQLPAIAARGVESSGFAGRGRSGNGIAVYGEWRDEKLNGFDGISIENCDAHGNRNNGITVGGGWDKEARLYSHRNVRIVGCRAWENAGDPEYFENWSGNGIFVAEADGVLIEKCEAWRNGYRCPARTGGPVGIWAAAANNVTIQHCHSHHNGTGASFDGGGFDFDGGVTNGLMQFNSSHDNAGPGFLIYEYSGSPYALKNIVVRQNISVNDGRKNSYGGFYIASDDARKGLSNVLIENNTVVVGPQEGAKPVAVRVRGKITGLALKNNLFLAQGVPLLEGEADLARVKFQGNAYLTPEGAKIRWNGADFDSVEAWKKASGQEETP